MAALRKPEDDDPQYKEIGLEGVGAEVGRVREKTKSFHIVIELHYLGFRDRLSGKKS